MPKCISKVTIKFGKRVPENDPQYLEYNENGGYVIGDLTALNCYNYSVDRFRIEKLYHIEDDRWLKSPKMLGKMSMNAKCFKKFFLPIED
jgi:hypothetical protein